MLGERTGFACRSNRSLGLARLIRAIRARQSRRQPFEREIGFFVAGEDIASILPSIVVRFYIFGIKEKLLLTNGYEIEFKSPLLCPPLESDPDQQAPVRESEIKWIGMKPIEVS